MRKSSALMVALLVAAGAVQAAEYTIDKAHSNVDFKIRHLVSKVRGHFNEYEGTISFDPDKIKKTKASAVIKTISIDTDNADRDKHLRSADFFHVEKYPEMKFESTKAKRKGKNAFQLHGKLTLRGTTKPVVLDAVYAGEVKDPWGNIKAGFSATGKINRKDFGMKWNKALDTGGVILGDEVEIILEIEAAKNK